MIRPEKLYQHLGERGIDFYTGVPDSLLKNFLAYLQDHTSDEQHVITANEGLAIGLATGYHLSSGKTALVYLQNSGLGNIINPLTSLADKEMYSIPMLLLIGWRGRPGTKDEPQHLKMGRITKGLLHAMEIPVVELSGDEENCFNSINQAIRQTNDEKRPVALLASDDIFENYLSKPSLSVFHLNREQVIADIISKLSGEELVICTTGKSGREFYECNKAAGEKITKYFLSVGAMGHANHVALGLHLQADEKLVMIDGDGALLMHLGSLPAIAHRVKNNFIHIVLNNGVHESVGGQPTEGFFVNFCELARASGYPAATSISNEKEWKNWLENGIDFSTLQLLEIKVSSKSRADLGRPEGSPREWKQALMNLLIKK